MKEHSIAILFKNLESHQNENISACTKCIQDNFEIFSIHFNEHCDESFPIEQTSINNENIDNSINVTKTFDECRIDDCEQKTKKILRKL